MLIQATRYFPITQAQAPKKSPLAQPTRTRTFIFCNLVDLHVLVDFMYKEIGAPYTQSSTHEEHTNTEQSPEERKK